MVLVLVDRGGMEVVQGGVRGIGMIGIGGLRQGIEMEKIEKVAEGFTYIFDQSNIG